MCVCLCVFSESELGSGHKCDFVKEANEGFMNTSQSSVPLWFVSFCVRVHVVICSTFQYLYVTIYIFFKAGIYSVSSLFNFCGPVGTRGLVSGGFLFSFPPLIIYAVICHV